MFAIFNKYGNCHMTTQNIQILTFRTYGNKIGTAGTDIQAYLLSTTCCNQHTGILTEYYLL